MKQQIDANENENGKSISNQPLAVLGAGQLTAMLWRCSDGQSGDSVRFNIFRVGTDNGQVLQTFGLSNVEDLVKLAQVLAYALADEQSVARELKDDLACLSSCLDDVLGPASRLPRPQVPPRGSMAAALKAVLDCQWDEAAESFAASPSNRHPYRQLVLVDRWLSGVVVAARAVLSNIDLASADPLGDCPICGSNDGYLNVRRVHWCVCHQHKTRWCPGEDLFSSWRCESPASWKANARRIRDYLVVQPVRPQRDIPPADELN